MLRRAAPRRSRQGRGRRPANGSVQVLLAAELRSVTVSVKDSGIGIPPEHQARVFERLYRVDKARAGASGHTGLGLAIAKAIVDNHGGSISVSSSVGHGTRFTVELPTSGSR